MDISTLPFLNFWLLPFFITLIGNTSALSDINASIKSSISTPLLLCSTEPITLATECLDFPLINISLLVFIPTILLSITSLISSYNLKFANAVSSPDLIELLYALNKFHSFSLYFIFINSSSVLGLF